MERVVIVAISVGIIEIFVKYFERATIFVEISLELFYIVSIFVERI